MVIENDRTFNFTASMNDEFRKRVAGAEGREVVRL